MPPRINGNVPGVQQFSAHADTAQGLSNRVLFRNGHLERASGLSAFFAGSQARRATVEAFRQSIVREYGQTVGAAFSPRLDPKSAKKKAVPV